MLFGVGMGLRLWGKGVDPSRVAGFTPSPLWGDGRGEGHGVSRFQRLIFWNPTRRPSGTHRVRRRPVRPHTMPAGASHRLPDGLRSCCRSAPKLTSLRYVQTVGASQMTMRVSFGTRAATEAQNTGVIEIGRAGHRLTRWTRPLCIGVSEPPAIEAIAGCERGHERLPRASGDRVV